MKRRELDFLELELLPGATERELSLGRGLIYVRTQHTRRFVFRFRWHGKLTRIPICHLDPGRPSQSLAEAREVSDRYLATLKAGKRPEPPLTPSPTVHELFERYAEACFAGNVQTKKGPKRHITCENECSYLDRWKTSGLAAWITEKDVRAEMSRV